MAKTHARKLREGSKAPQVAVGPQERLLEQVLGQVGVAHAPAEVAQQPRAHLADEGLKAVGIPGRRRGGQFLHTACVVRGWVVDCRFHRACPRQPENGDRYRNGPKSAVAEPVPVFLPSFLVPSSRLYFSAAAAAGLVLGPGAWPWPRKKRTSLATESLGATALT